MDRNPDEHPLLRHQPVEIVDTDDEWEGLFGVAVDFLDDDGISRHAHCHTVTRVVVRIPTEHELGLEGRIHAANELCSYVRACLRERDDEWEFARDNVEAVDADDLP